MALAACAPRAGTAAPAAPHRTPAPVSTAGRASAAPTAASRTDGTGTTRANSPGAAPDVLDSAAAAALRAADDAGRDATALDQDLSQSTPSSEGTNP